MSVALWLGRVAPVAAQAAATGQDWLSESERARLDALSAPQRRAQFLAGRWGLRHLLAATCGGDAFADWRVSAMPDAPPRLERGPCTAHIAISHSGDFVACAVSPNPVGLDVETPRPRDIAGLTASVCTATEQQWLHALPAHQRVGYFYRLWTLKEAWLKRTGEGLSISRLAALHARPALEDEAVEGRLWQSGCLTLALIAPPALPLAWHGIPEGLDLDAPEYWRVLEIG